MANIVFTGKGENPKGDFVVRAECERLAEEKGHHIQRGVTRSTDYLVAARHDTVKADKAREFGTHVITYKQFFELLAVGAITNKDTAIPKVEPLDFSDCEDEEGWGMF